MSSDIKDLAAAERRRYEEERDMRDEERRILEAIEKNTARQPQAVQSSQQAETARPGFAARLGNGIVGALSHGSKRSIHLGRAHGTLLFLIWVFVLNMLFTILGNGGPLFNPIFLTLYVATALAAYFLVYPSDEFDLKRLLGLIAFSFAAYLFPAGIMYWKAHSLGGIALDGNLARFLAIFFPLWLLYILAHEQSGATRTLTTIILIAWILYVFIGFLFTGLAGVDAQAVLLSPGEIWEAMLQVYRTGIQPIFTGGKKLVTQPQTVFSDTKNFFKGQVSQATQEYYVGQVESTEGQPVGVFITDLQPVHTRFYIGSDDVIVAGVIKARTFTDSISIDNKCYLEYTDATLSAGQTKKDGAVIPQKITVLYTGEFQDKYDIECTVKKLADSDVKGKFISGTVVFNSTFDFTTIGYAQYGFMDQQLISAFRRENTDPATVLGIPRTVTPKYTPGPVMLGMSTDTLPIAYNSDEKDLSKVRLPAFGLTISNAWMGKGNIERIDSVSIYLPKPFLLDTTACTPDGVFKDVRRVDWKENARYNEYTLTVPKESPLQLRDKELYTTIRCPMQLDTTAMNQYPVLGTSGAGVYTFFANTTYVYSLSAKAPVELRQDQTSTT